MPVPGPSSLADRFTDESSKDGSPSGSDDEDDGVEVGATMVKANAPTEGITFNGSIHYREDLNSTGSLGRGRGLLWKRPTIPPRDPSPVEILYEDYEKDRRKRTSHSPARKSSERGKGTSSNIITSDIADPSIPRYEHETMRPPSTQPKPVPKTMTKATSTTSAPAKPPAQVQDGQSRKAHPFASKHMLGPARKTAPSSAPTSSQEGYGLSASQGQPSKTTGGSIFRPPSQTSSKAAPQQQQARHPQAQPQPQSSSSQTSFRTTSQTAYSQTQGQRPSSTQRPVSNSVFKPPNQPLREPSTQRPPANVHREARIPPPNVGNDVLNDPSRGYYHNASSQPNDPQPGTQQPYPTKNVSRAPPQPVVRPVIQPIRSGLLLSQPTPSRRSPSQPSGPDDPQPLATTTLPPQALPRPQPQPQMSTSEPSAQRPASTSATPVPGEGSFQRIAAFQPSEVPNLTVQDIESKLKAFVPSVGEDHARYVECLLYQAEQMAPEPKHLSKFDAFADMPALSTDAAPVSDAGVETMAFKLKLHHGDNGKPRAPTKAFTCPVVKIKTDKEAVPKYRFHHTELKKNTLVPNMMLTFVPHLRDVDPDSPAEKEYIAWLNELNKLDKDSGFKTENREQKQNKRIRDEYTATLSMYVEPWLKKLGLDVVCTRSTLIRYMLSQEENQAHLTQQQKDAFLKTYKDDAALAPEATEAARMFTEAFNTVFGNTAEPERSITLREVLLLEKRETVEDEKRAKESPPPAHAELDQSEKNGLVQKVEASLSSYTVLGCNTCFSHDCEHGDIDKFNYHRTFSLDSIGGIVRVLKRKWTDQIASMGGDDEAAAAAVSKKAMHLPCHNACYRHYDIGPAAAPVTPWEPSEISVLEDTFISVGHSQTLKAQCVVAGLLGRKCWEVYRKIKELDLSLPHVSPPRPPKPGPKGGGPTAKVKPLPWYDRRKKCLTGDWQNETLTHEHQQREITEPCHHDGPCSKDNPACPCANHDKRPILCDRLCQCTVDDCPYKFTGCACHSSGKTCIQKQKEGKPCICLLLNRECDPALCKGCGAKERADPDNRHDEGLHSWGCQNVSLQRGTTKTLLLGKSQLEGCGYGLYTAEDIAQDSYVTEYTGEMISHDEGVRREARRGGEGFAFSGVQGGSSYLFTLQEHEGIWVDAAMYGNESRYINHASESDKKACNIGPKIVYVNYEYRIKFVALRDIKAGEELFFNYGDNFPNLTKKLMQKDGDGGDGDEGDSWNTGKGRGKGKRGGRLTSSSLAQGTARKATTKASITTTKGRGRARGGRKMTALEELPPSDDDEDATWIKDPLPLPEDDDEDDEDYDVGRKRKRPGGRRTGAGRRKKAPSPEPAAEAEPEGDADAADAAVANANAEGPSGLRPTRTTRTITRTRYNRRTTRAVSEISDSQAERDDEDDDNGGDDDDDEAEEAENQDNNQSEEEDSDTPLSPSRRRRRQLHTAFGANHLAPGTRSTYQYTGTVMRLVSESESGSAYATAASSSTSTPAGSQPGDGEGEGAGGGGGEGDGDDEGEGEGTHDQDQAENQDQDQDQEEEGGQAKKRSNRGGARPGAGRKPGRNMLRHANSGSTSRSASTSASESTSGLRQWDRLKASVASGSGSVSRSASASASAANSHTSQQPSKSPSAPPGPITSAISPTRGTKKRKAVGEGDANMFSFSSMENSSVPASVLSLSEVEEPDSNHVSKRQKTSTSTGTSSSHQEARNTLLTRNSSRAATTAAAKTHVSPERMKIKPSGVSVTRSPGGGLRAQTAHTAQNASQHSAAAQAQLRAQELLRSQRVQLQHSQPRPQPQPQAQAQAQLQHTESTSSSGASGASGASGSGSASGSGTGMYHTAANFQPFTSDNDDEDGEEDGEEEEEEEEDVASVASAVSEEEDDGSESEGEGADVEVEVESQHDDGEDSEDGNGEGEDEDDGDGEEEEEEEDSFGGFSDDAEDDAGAASGSESAGEDDGDDEDEHEHGDHEGEGDDDDREDEDSEGEDSEGDDQAPVKNLRPRRSQPTSSSASAPLVGGKVLRQRSGQRLSQSQSRSQSRGRVARQSSSTRGRGSVRQQLTTRNSSRNSSNPQSNHNPSPKKPSKSSKSSATTTASASTSRETRGTKRSSSSSRSNRSTRGRSRSRGEERTGSREGAGRKGGEGAEEGRSRKRQKPLRYRNEEE